MSDKLTRFNDFISLEEGLRNHIKLNTHKLKEFFPFYEEAISFMVIRNILPNNDFTKKRIDMIGRDLALTIFFSMNDLYEEGQILLRQLMDLISIIIFGANHVLEIEDLDKGKLGQIGNIKTEIEKKLPQEIRSVFKTHYRKLSCVVHGTVKDILLEVSSVNENWENPGKVGHWKNDFTLTLDLLLCLCKSWLPQNYAKLDVAVRSNLENKFKFLKKSRT